MTADEVKCLQMSSVCVGEKVIAFTQNCAKDDVSAHTGVSEVHL